LAFGLLDRPPFELADADLVVLVGLGAHAQRLVVVPGRWVGILHVIYLPAGGGVVALLLQVLRQGDGVFDDRAEPKRLAVVVDARGRGHLAGHDGRAGRIAQWRRRIGSLEGHPPPTQPVDVGCPSVGMPAKSPHPVVQVVRNDKQHVRAVTLCAGAECGHPLGRSHQRAGDPG